MLEPSLASLVLSTETDSNCGSYTKLSAERGNGSCPSAASPKLVLYICLVRFNTMFSLSAAFAFSFFKSNLRLFRLFSSVDVLYVFYLLFVATKENTWLTLCGNDCFLIWTQIDKLALEAKQCLQS